jgi:predicted NUDIX family NTP pyrophosphohydrolase
MGLSTQSAGLLVHRQRAGELEVLLVHPAGPLWSSKDSWSIPKGIVNEDETEVAAAYREFREEVGLPAPEGELIALGQVKQSSGKRNSIWAVVGDIDTTQFTCNSFTMEWPPRSGRMQEFPENDRAEWFTLPLAKQKIFVSQAAFLDRLAQHYELPPIVAATSQQSLL